MTGLEDRCDAGARIVGHAGDLALDYFARRAELDVSAKANPQDLVSEADRAVELLIRDAIHDAVPCDGIIGEEHGCAAGDSDWNWIVDPIDGTSSFLHGLRGWSVSVALRHGTRTVAGWVADPSGGRLYRAVAGQGAWLGDSRLRVSEARLLEDGLTAVGSGHPDRMGALIAALLSRGGAFQRNGSAALSLAHVAAGHYLGFYEPRLSPWDCAAGLLLIEEAGGVSDPHPLDRPAPVLAGAPGVIAELRNLVATTELAEPVD
ncbi:inositol monophosphatase family protein [Pelagovum pacificum]|uniref:Inositol-1-monophosphatase n=1 Tax=Pelagovum pacificum TaxID=2588711 RepID=A0A5C5G8X2_9RHOB|nr:inositol monophosphatase [Pelagovum pacificum]QQA41726.1 inositol monophosphatase [Pelagovum pacificum]TNY31001.1 inositol monophosphatase [Pelagovum pacificum]